MADTGGASGGVKSGRGSAENKIGGRAARAGDDPRRPARWVSKLAEVMDTKFAIPGTGVRFGLDPIIGLLPVAGDTITVLIGAAMLYESRRLGLGKRVAAKICGNLAVDWLVGLIPGLDLIFDTMYKAHKKNADLIIREAARQSGRPAAKRVVNEAGPGAAGQGAAGKAAR